MQTLKGVGVAIALVVALMAATAVAASEDEFQADYYPVEVKGQQTEAQVLAADGLSVSCSTATLVGELSKGQKEIEVTPSYSECIGIGQAATVAMEGCKYRLDAGGGDMDIVCPAGKAIKVTAKNCEMTIGSQSGLSTLTYSGNEGPPATVTTNASVKAVKYNKIKDGFVCPFSGTGEKEDGTLTAQSLLKAFKAAAQVDMFVGGPASAVINTPDGVDFKVNDQKKFVIENTGGTPLDITGEGLPIPTFFKIQKSCIGKSLAKKSDSCTVEIKCVNAGVGTNSYAVLLTGNLNPFVNLKCT